MQEDDKKLNDLAKLNFRINEIRKILDEICSSLDEGIDYNERLYISKYLDDLIVEYMKKLNTSSES